MTPLDPIPGTTHSPVRSYQAARMQRATLGDTARLCRLYRLARPERPESEESMREWLENGGALLLENEDGEALCALRWHADERGWRLDSPLIPERVRGLGFGRWLMTRVEALAIRHNVASLSVTVIGTELLPLYERMGYRATSTAGGVTTLRKSVGGTWQYQGRAS